MARLRVHLRPFERRGLVDVWSDTKIRTGQQWKQEIKKALDRAAVAILLVSADFLASDFVAENELPPLLAAVKGEGACILPVILKPCAFSDISEIAQFQALNDPAEPLLSMDEANRERLWYTLALEVKNALEEFAQKNDKPETKPVELLTEECRWHFELAHFILGEEIADPGAIDDYHVYSYEHVDLLDFMPLADKVLRGFANSDAIMQAVKNRLSQAGWKGDGSLRLLWLPPFVGAGVEDTYGVAIWFVKQDDNGTSWLASPVPLPFSRLLAYR